MCVCLGHITAYVTLHNLMAQDHFMVCFTISLYKGDNGCCLFAIKIFCYASHDVSTVLLGRLHCGNVQLKFLSWVLIHKVCGIDVNSGSGGLRLAYESIGSFANPRPV